MPRLPHSAAPFLFAVIQSALTTGVATAIATFQSPGSLAQLFPRWLASWGISWALLLPVVITAAPFIRRAVATVTERP